MPRKVVNRKELRAASEAAEKTAAKKTTTKKAKTKKTTKKKSSSRQSRKQDASDVRLKAYWGVFNQSLKRVALFEYSQRKEADKKAAELSASGKSPHFVQPVKEVIDG